MLARCCASSLDCSTPFDVRGGSVGIPVGVLIEAVYCPVWGSTLQLDRNYGCQTKHAGYGGVRLGAAHIVVCVMKGDQSCKGAGPDGTGSSDNVWRGDRGCGAIV
jgi:hypothetical protein